MMRFVPHHIYTALILLPITNVLPSLFHWCWGLAGLWNGHLGCSAELAQKWAKQVIANEPLNISANAEDVANYLFLDHRWFGVALGFCLLAWVILGFDWLLPETLHLLLGATKH
jgi:hypothetical protein